MPRQREAMTMSTTRELSSPKHRPISIVASGRFLDRIRTALCAVPFLESGRQVPRVGIDLRFPALAPAAPADSRLPSNYRLALGLFHWRKTPAFCYLLRPSKPDCRGSVT